MIYGMPDFFFFFFFAHSLQIFVIQKQNAEAFTQFASLFLVVW